ncbi:glycosyltransferase family 2 protein [Pseudonocardia spirodelae]|uniref:Glycosyltransferase family 2 protein n=1 Tax=Pseudonocardia spirodelae TaxID=3133431 RepID=A0ABU8T2S2_9PSEU
MTASPAPGTSQDPPGIAPPLAGARSLHDFSRISGEITEPPADGTVHRVRYRNLHDGQGRSRWVRTLAIIGANVAFEVLFVVWLLQPSHHPDVDERWWIQAANVFVIGSIALVEGLRLVNVFSLSLASVLARDPVPVRPDPALRVAFLTTIVPGKEPVEMVRATLEAARRIRHAGTLDVWLLDEGDDADVRRMCAEIGVRHFSRKGTAGYNTDGGFFAARTKHGNYNAWVHAEGHRYDVFLSVDPDHVPLPNYAERMLGYFRDPDVAFVVGPQCYANCDTFVTRAAESQQFPFHSLIQRAANAYGIPMLVGTNNAVRIDALLTVGGLHDSITEDMATGLALHARRNPWTGARWRSVYTPDVVAVGEGPSSWTDYFSQQLRWSRGTFEILQGVFLRRLRRLSPPRMLHYLLITTFYPSMAVGWVLGAVNASLYLAFGVSGIVVPPALWLALYVDATAFQLWVYVRNRRYNVSPYENENSSGIHGMAMSVLSAPIYASSLVATVLRRPARFVVTPKAEAASPDRLVTFARHLRWSAFLAAAIAASFALGYANLDVLMWPALALLISLVPMLVWLGGLWRDRGAVVTAAELVELVPDIELPEPRDETIGAVA